MSSLKKNPISHSFGQLIEGLNLKRNGSIVLLYPLFSLIRRLILVLTCVYLKSYPVFSIFSINFQTLFMIMIVGLMCPYSLRSANQMELFNETCVILINYHLMCFTDFVLELERRDQVGYSLIVVTILNVAVNLLVISV